MHSVAFSSDGSLIAVGTGSCVTLWNSGDGSYVASLAGALSLEDESFPLLAFVSGTPFLAGTPDSQSYTFPRQNEFLFPFGRRVLQRGILLPQE